MKRRDRKGGGDAEQGTPPRGEPFRLLFVCTGNSARSQLAEGLANHLGGDRVFAQSAGTLPVGVNAHARAVLQERGIDISHHYSKGIDDVVRPFDLVITLCDSAASECPAAFLGSQPHEHWSTPDPSFVRGGPEAVRESFRETRDRLERQLRTLFERALGPSGGTGG
ncbi:MAG: arsenate reductase ArsC [Candidatus Polarisedimenticolia bacterium]